MIGRLCGILIEKKPPQLLIDINGVGYEVEAPMSTFYKLPETGQSVTLYTHFIVRQDAQLLYAFYQQNERALFRSLIKVNGVGPKLALTILSGIEPEPFIACIHDHDTSTLVRLPGVGKRTAERLIVEMRDRIDDWYSDEMDVENNLTSKLVMQGAASEFRDATNALISLGYKANEVKKMLAAIETKNLTSEQMIRQALQGAATCQEKIV